MNTRRTLMLPTATSTANATGFPQLSLATTSTRSVEMLSHSTATSRSFTLPGAPLLNVNAPALRLQASAADTMPGGTLSVRIALEWVYKIRNADDRSFQNRWGQLELWL